jgi:hypothetical protein
MELAAGEKTKMGFERCFHAWGTVRNLLFYSSMTRSADGEMIAVFALREQFEHIMLMLL